MKLHHHGDRVPAPQTSGHTIHWAFFYDVLGVIWFLGREQAVREMTLDLARLALGENVLDVGCGTGTLTLAAKRRVGPTGSVHGVDAAPEMIDRARRKAIKAGVDVTFQTALAEALPFSDAQFDVVLSSLMLHHLPEDLRRTGLAEMHRVLKPGGRLLAVDFEPLQHPLGRALTRLVLGHTMASYDIRSCLPMMQAAGFREIESGPTRFRRLSFLRGMTPA